MDTSDKSGASSEVPARRRMRTLEEKLRILAQTDEPGASVAAVARKHDLNANLLFAWRRLQRRGLLEGQRHAPPLLPVKIASPTLTPTRRTSVAAEHVRTRKERASATESFIEIIVGEARIRLHGEAQRALLERVLEWWPRR